MFQKSFVIFVAALGLSAPLRAQAPAQAAGRARAQGQAQERPRADPHKIDNYLCDWHEAMPHQTHGGLVERDILTQGNPQNPPTRCAVLVRGNRLSHATLAARGGIAPMKLQGEQEIMIVVSGKGTITSGGQTWDLYDGMAMFLPSGVEFSMKNMGDEDLNIYMMNEKIPATFKPVAKIVVRDTNLEPVRGTTGHWVHITKGLFSSTDGLANLTGSLVVAVDPMTIPEPHAHTAGTEEVWLQIKGKSLLFLGTQLRWQTPGMGYLAPPFAAGTKENITAGLSFPHSNINPGTEQVKLLYFKGIAIEQPPVQASAAGQ